MSPPRLLIIALPLLLAGCTFRAAMTRGQEAVDRADWPAAARAYDEALAADPEDPRAQQAAADARARWQMEALATFDQALAAGDLATARRAADEVERARPGEAVGADVRGGSIA
ncbi:MAG: hypothetical protein H6706_06000 [Myxococcales bacterium]|nr:hypothetical protein [Myxococcales bacterium]